MPDSVEPGPDSFRQIVRGRLQLFTNKQLLTRLQSTPPDNAADELTARHARSLKQLVLGRRHLRVIDPALGVLEQALRILVPFRFERYGIDIDAT